MFYQVWLWYLVGGKASFKQLNYFVQFCFNKEILKSKEDGSMYQT